MSAHQLSDAIAYYTETSWETPNRCQRPFPHLATSKTTCHGNFSATWAATSASSGSCSAASRDRDRVSRSRDAFTSFRTGIPTVPISDVTISTRAAPEMTMLQSTQRAVRRLSKEE